MEQHVFRFTNKLSPKTSQDASRQYIFSLSACFPSLFSFYLSRSFQFMLEFIIFKLLMRVMNASWKFLFILCGLKAFFTFFSFFILLKKKITRNICAAVDQGCEVGAIHTVMNVIWISHKEQSVVSSTKVREKIKEEMKATIKFFMSREKPWEKKYY